MDISTLSSADLVRTFLSKAQEQAEAISLGQTAKFNHLYDAMAAIELELKTRDGDHRRQLTALYDDANAHVRLSAAIATLAPEPHRARQILQDIGESEDYPAAADARITLRELEKGDFVPE